MGEKRPQNRHHFRLGVRMDGKVQSYRNHTSLHCISYLVRLIRRIHKFPRPFEAVHVRIGIVKALFEIHNLIENTRVNVEPETHQQISHVLLCQLRSHNNCRSSDNKKNELYPRSNNGQHSILRPFINIPSHASSWRTTFQLQIVLKCYCSHYREDNPAQFAER